MQLLLLLIIVAGVFLLPLNNNKLHKNAITPATRISSRSHPTTVEQQQITQECVIFY
ncbi:MAG: hypothetical protein K0S93_1682 [Nitrososphaeraceae archaeon]|nr:hypothetical protein [Nitrososphaeraceae archaeon]